MYNLDQFIDSFQNGKKTAIKIFITNKNIADAMTEFVDAQSEYTKKAFKTTNEAFLSIANETVKSMHEATKFDYNKFGEGIMKAYTNMTKTV
jgi:hypothetical protein